MYVISSDSVITSIVSNAIAVLVLRVARRGLCFVILKVTHVSREDPRTTVNTRFGGHFSKIKLAVGRLLSELMN